MTLNANRRRATTPDADEVEALRRTDRHDHRTAVPAEMAAFIAQAGARVDGAASVLAARVLHGEKHLCGDDVDAALVRLLDRAQLDLVHARAVG